MQWVKATRGGEHTVVYVNLANAMSIRRLEKQNATRITWPGGQEDHVTVNETPEELFAAGRYGA